MKMVDNIEVTLEEVERLIAKHANLVDREERARVRAMKEEREYFNKLNPQSTAKGGFLDSIIKGITGRGVMGGIAGGIAAGGTAGGILVLADVITNLTKQSKILGEVQSSLQKSVSLLVDLVLLPFLPLIFGAIIQLYTSIVAFGGWWKDVWDTVQKEGLGGLIKLTLEWMWGSIVQWQQDFLNWVFGDKPIIQKVLDVFKGIQDAFLDSNIPMLPFTWRTLLGWIFGGGYSAKGSVTFGILPEWAKGVQQFFIDILNFIFGVSTKALNRQIDFSLNLLKGDPGSWLWKILESTPGIGMGISAARTAMDIVIPAPAPSPAGSSSSSQIFNFYGLQPEGLVSEVKNILRQFGLGWIL